MMDWIPVVFVTFKVLVLGTGMFFAVKWHYDKGRRGKATDKRAVLRGGIKVAAVFVVSLLCLWLVTSVIMKVVGLDLTYP